MARIPVGATIAHAYGFAFRNFLKIVGVMWLAMAVMWIPSLLLRSQMMAVATSDPAAIYRMLPILIPFYIVSLVLMSMQMIGIARLALGNHTGSYWYYFSLGRPVWRLIGSLLLFLFAMIIGCLALLLVNLLLGFLERLLVNGFNFPALTATMGVALVFAVIATWCFLFYSMVRLSFLLLPVIAADEEGFALGRAWELGKGNFWRMFLIMLVIMLPFLLLEGVMMFYLFQGVSFPPTPASPQQTAAFQAAVNAHTVAMVNGMYHYWYLAFVPAVALMVLLYGIAVGAQCFAYRALTGSGPVAGNALPD